MSTPDCERTSREAARQEKIKAQLERFIFRLRFIAAHSLAADRDRLVDLCETKMDLIVSKYADGTTTYDAKPIPFLPEEQIESAIARVRPVLLDRDGISYRQVLGGLGEHLDASEREELSLYREQFEEFDPDSRGGQPKEPHRVGDPVTNKQVAGAWLYGSLVHADAIRQSFVRPLSYEAIFVEAQRITCGLVLVSVQTLDFLELLVERGRIGVAPEVFTASVSLSATSWAPKIEAIHTAPIGTDLPRAYDEPLGSEWERLGDMFEGPA